MAEIQDLPPLCGISNGNGPAHLLPAGKESKSTLCGRTRFDVYRLFHDREVCRECQRIQRRPRPDPAAIEELEGTLKDFAAIREKVAAQLGQLRGRRGIVSGRVLLSAYEAGFSGPELATLMGVTRQAVMTRLDYVRRCQDKVQDGSEEQR